VVAGEDEDSISVLLADEIEILEDGVCGAAVPQLAGARLIRVQQAHAAARAVHVPGLADADVLVERVRLILRQHRHVEDAGVDAVREGEVDDAELASEGDRRLRPDVGEDAEPCAGAPGQNHRDDAHGILLVRELPLL